MSEEIYETIIKCINEFALDFAITLAAFRGSEVTLGDVQADFDNFMRGMADLEAKYQQALRAEEMENQPKDNQ